MKTFIIILVVLVIIVGGYFLFTNNNSSTQNSVQTPTYNSQSSVNNTPTPSPISGTTSPPTPHTIPTTVINIKNLAFNPSTVTVKAGTIVTWVNNDSVPHTITSDSGSLLHSSNIAAGQSFSFTFAATGTINYHCSVHPMMHGKIIVQS